MDLHPDCKRALELGATGDAKGAVAWIRESIDRNVESLELPWLMDSVVRLAIVSADIGRPDISSALMGEFGQGVEALEASFGRVDAAHEERQRAAREATTGEAPSQQAPVFGAKPAKGAVAVHSLMPRPKIR
jgi:hypothetical protein